MRPASWDDASYRPFVAAHEAAQQDRSLDTVAKVAEYVATIQKRTKRDVMLVEADGRVLVEEVDGQARFYLANSKNGARYCLAVVPQPGLFGSDVLLMTTRMARMLQWTSDPPQRGRARRA